MATTTTFTASLATRKNNKTTNHSNDTAHQAHYQDGSFNYCGIVHFPDLNLKGKVITEIKLKVTSDNAGHAYEKIAYIRKSNFQNKNESGV